MAVPAENQVSARRGKKSAAAFRTISEVAAELDLPQHVLRFWESKFPSVKPLKRGGGRRYYRPEDVNHLKQIRKLLYDEGYTIKGVQKLLQKNGAKPVALETKAEADKKPLAVIAETVAPVSPGLDPAMRQSLEAALKELESLRSLLKASKP
ncbi:MAG: MerR family transcriptional regulator [Rhodospirillales bacterium]